MDMHMLSLTLNGLPSSLIWAWSRTPVRALEWMTLSQWTDTISSCFPDRQSVYSLCPYSKYPLHTRVSVKWTKNPDVYSCIVPLGLCGVCLWCLCVDGLDLQSLVFVRNFSCLLWPPPTHSSIYIYGESQWGGTEPSWAIQHTQGFTPSIPEPQRTALVRGHHKPWLYVL